jgi:ABC-type sugar transport system permease subunit
MNKFFQNKIAILVFILPALVIYTIFVVYPIIPLLITSLQEHDGVSSHGFIGLRNYIEIFSMKRLLKANVNNLYITGASIFIGIPYSLGLAFIMHFARIKFMRIFKAIYFLPVVISTPIICQAWLAILNPEWGLVNSLLKIVGLEALRNNWLTNTNTVIPSIIIVMFWQYLGFNMTIFYAGLTTIPDKYFEAALIDGANRFQSAIKIAVPLLSNIIKFLIITSIIGCMSTFAHVQIMTRGGPGDASFTIVYMIYNYSFVRNRFGMGSSISIFFIIECMLISVILNRYVARERIEF